METFYVSSTSTDSEKGVPKITTGHFGNNRSGTCCYIDMNVIHGTEALFEDFSKIYDAFGTIFL